MSETASRLPRPAKKMPGWADVVRRFYTNSFDATNRASLLESIDAWASMDRDEQSFHTAHLAFRQVQAFADVHLTLEGIERGLARLDPKALAALKHLPGVKRALVVIARGQQDVLAVLESNAPNGVSGEDDDDDDDDRDSDDVDDDDADGEDSDGEDDEDSDLADAVDADEIEEEDHGTGDAPIVPEVIPAGARRPAPSEGGAS